MELQRHPDSHLWMAALSLSILVSMLLFGLGGLFFVHFEWRMDIEQVAKSEESTEATIYFEPLSSNAQERETIESQDKPFARTSPDQPVSTEKTHERIGERSTLATSDRAPDPTAEALPSQSGIEPKQGEIETTESNYQDGELVPSVPTTPSADVTPSPLTPSANPPSPLQTNPNAEQLQSEQRPEAPPVEPVEQSDPTLSEERSLPPPRETLLSGPDSVDVHVPKEQGESERPRETPRRPTTNTPEIEQPAESVASNPAVNTQPKAFQGYQRKTAVVGSISRTGRSALNVDDTELGRYQAAISKAVELEWQRNCMRHRDFITPGFLTVRFYVEPSGRVRSVNFVGEMETGEVQKGFTLSSIREAEIPKMPVEMAKAYEGDTLELVFRFYF